MTIIWERFSCEKKNTQKRQLNNINNCNNVCKNYNIIVLVLASSAVLKTGHTGASPHQQVQKPNSGSLLRRELLLFGQSEHFSVAAEQMLSPDERRFNQIKLISLPDFHPSPVREFQHTHTNTNNLNLHHQPSILCHWLKKKTKKTGSFPPCVMWRNLQLLSMNQIS